MSGVLFKFWTPPSAVSSLLMVFSSFTTSFFVYFSNSPVAFSSLSFFRYLILCLIVLKFVKRPGTHFCVTYGHLHSFAAVLTISVACCFVLTNIIVLPSFAEAFRNFKAAARAFAVLLRSKTWIPCFSP